MSNNWTNHYQKYVRKFSFPSSSLGTSSVFKAPALKVWGKQELAHNVRFHAGAWEPGQV